MRDLIFSPSAAKILRPKTPIDGEHKKASNIQEALTVALEKAITSASVLLREALIGRIRACEAEQQVGYKANQNLENDTTRFVPPCQGSRAALLG